MPRKCLLVPDPVLDRGDGALREGVRGDRDRRLRVHRLRGDDAEVACRELAGVRRRTDEAEDVARADEPEPVRVDRIDLRSIEVVGPDLDVVELREVGSEQRSHRATPDHADPHEYEASRARTSA